VMSNFVDYYKLLGVSTSASPENIRQAYKRESLRTHPDRLPKNASSADRQRATAAFQAVADAYYVLSDPTRRRDYDQRYTSSGDNRTSDFFTQQPDPNGVFADVFEELLRPEVQRSVPWWTYLGALCGAGIGFIIANIPGLMIGAYAGNRLGAVRDAKGKSVAVVFSQLGGSQKAEILRALAMKILGSGM